MTDVESLLADLFEDRWPADRNAYDLNVALHLKPWAAPLVTVWQSPDGPPDGWGSADANGWPEARALLDQLHQKYLDARGHE